MTFEEAGPVHHTDPRRSQLELFHRLEFARPATNAQLWWALFTGLPVCWWMRRATRAPAFSLFFAATAALLCLATLLRMGMLDWVDHDPGRFYFHLIPCAALFLGAGYLFENRNHPEDSRYFYPFAVAFTWAALTGVATYHEPYAMWLNRRCPVDARSDRIPVPGAMPPSTSRWIASARRFPSPQLHNVGKAFRFVIPGHVLTSLLLLGIVRAAGVEAQVPSNGCCRPWRWLSSSPAFRGR